MRPWRWTLLIVSALCLGAAPSGSTLPSDVELRSSEDKILYALGLKLHQDLESFELSAEEFELVLAGMSDAYHGHPEKAALGIWEPRIVKLMQRRQEAAARIERAKSKPLLAEKTRAKGAIKRASGLIYRELEPGDGASPNASDTVKVHYRGRRIDGTIFDSSHARGAPAEFPLQGVIRCWTEGLQLMKVGGKSELVCPDSIAYGLQGSPGKIKPGATLVFEVELLEILTPGPAQRSR